MKTKLPQLLKQHGITQAELAAAIGVTAATISRWTGNRVTTFDTDIVERMCRYFDIEVGDLLYIERANGNHS